MFWGIIIITCSVFKKPLANLVKEPNVLNVL